MNTQRAHAYGNVPTWTFGDKVRKARDISGLLQKEFAAAIDITASSLAAYETGRSTPRFNDAPRIAKRIQMLTSIPFEWFLVEDVPTPTDGNDGWAPSGSNRRPKDYQGDGTTDDDALPPVSDLAAERERRHPSMVEVSA
jgi:transcriptional regulator with XRE-family HTH domain